MSSELGLYGLGVMGSSLAKNLINHNFKVSLFSYSKDERECFSANVESSLVHENLQSFVASLASPKKIMLMITAGNPVDAVIESLLPLLTKGDIIIDCGNSYYHDTAHRQEKLEPLGIYFLGVGVSGGEYGALTGPSIMVGGSEPAWLQCKNILQTIAAKTENDEPCCGYVGKGGAGHYVKMVHNGIEYAILQLIADIYEIMKIGVGLSNDEIAGIFKVWNTGPLKSYLIEITGNVLSAKTDEGDPLVDIILDIAKANGTGNWASIDSIKNNVFCPTITQSVYIRIISHQKKLREKGHEKLSKTVFPFNLDNWKKTLHDALLLGIITSYSQGIDLIKTASVINNWGINLPLAVSLWRQGCIIRSVLLEQIIPETQKCCDNILLSDKFDYIKDLEPSLRRTVLASIGSGISVSTLESTLSYYDCLATDRMSVALIQGLRDCFGAHRYERTDKEGAFHSTY